MPACRSIPALPRPVNFSPPTPTSPLIPGRKGSASPPASSAAAADAGCGLVNRFPMRASSACLTHACPEAGMRALTGHHPPRLRCRLGGHRRHQCRARAAPAAADPASSLARVPHLRRAEWYERHLSVYVRQALRTKRTNQQAGQTEHEDDSSTVKRGNAHLTRQQRRCLGGQLLVPRLHRRSAPCQPLPEPWPACCHRTCALAVMQAGRPRRPGSPLVLAQHRVRSCLA